MADAQINVTFAGPLVTVQDAGRKGQMRYGVSASGPMDRLAFAAAHAALGNPAGGAAIEVSLGGLMLHCTRGNVTLAVAGGDFVIEHAGQKVTGWSVLTLRQGERLAIRAGKTGSWCYLAFAGELQTTRWLDSAATHAGSGFGGGALAAGQVLHIADAALREERTGEIPRPDLAPQPRLRVVAGPQDRYFAAGTLQQFTESSYRVTDAYDRMGMRLSGPALSLDGALSIPSEPVVRGAVQVAGDGVPTVLLADHQTTGGYPKIATVISADLDDLTQARSGAVVRFATVTPQEAIVAARDRHAAISAYLERIAVPRGTLAQRLMRENLITAWPMDEA